MEKQQTLGRLEMASTVAWFLMDACWKMDWMMPAYYFSILNVILMSFVAGYTDGRREMLAQAATFSWLLMNIFWMVGEVVPRYNAVSTVFMCLGIVLIAALLMMDGGANRLLRRFRIK